jgi:hypothetical protein
MASYDNKTQIMKLNGSNFQSWKFNMKCLLMNNSLWGFVSGTEVKPEIVEEIKDEAGNVTNAETRREGF